MKPIFVSVAVILGGVFSLETVEVEPLGHVFASTNVARLTQSKRPLTLAQIQQLIAIRTADKVIAGEIRKRGIGFKLDAKTLGVLRKRGAGPLTAQALSAYLPKSALAIITTPPDCDVYIDEVYRDRTDVDGRLRLPDLEPGDHKITVRKARYREARDSVSLYPDKEERIEVNLALAVGLLTVLTNVPDASVGISGMGTFTAPVRDLECPPGAYAVSVSSQRHTTATRQIEVVAGEKTEVSIDLNVELEAIGSLLASAREAYASQQYDNAIRITKDILSTDPKQPKALSILAEGYFMNNDFENFKEFAGQALDAGGEIEFALKHHHGGFSPLRPGGVDLHPIKLVLSANSISFDPQVTDVMSCSYRPFTAPVGQVAAVELAGNQSNEVYLVLKFFKDAANPKKTAKLSFVDRDSYVEEGVKKSVLGGMVTVVGNVLVSRHEAFQAMSAIKDVFDREAHSGENSAAATIASGNKLYEQGTPDSLRKAIARYKEALSLFSATANRDGESKALQNTAAAYTALGDMQRAIDFGSQALLLFRSLGDRKMEAAALRTIGTAYSALGDGRKAIDFASQALSLYQRIGDQPMEAFMLGVIGGTYNDLGEKQKALDFLGQALLICRKLGIREGEGIALSYIGAVYASLGEEERALDYNLQALQLQRKAGDRQGEANTLNFMGAFYLWRDRKKEALDYHNKALKLFRATGNRGGEAETLMNIGNAYSTLGENQKALSVLHQVLQIKRQLGDQRGEAITLAILAEIHGELGEKQKALDLGNQALQLFHNMGLVMAEAHAHLRFAQAWRDEGNLIEARNHIKEALRLAESMRANVINQELRSSYFASVQEYYEVCIDLLMQLHKQRPSEALNAEALQTSERARARSLLELLTEAHADIRQGVDLKLVDRERSLHEQLNAKAQLQDKVLSGPHSEEQTSTFSKDIDDLRTELQQVQTQIRQTSPRYAALTQPQPLPLKEIQTQVLDADTLLLEYSLGKDRSYLWAVTPDSITTYELPKRDEIEQAARELYIALSTDPSDSSQRGVSLGKGQKAAPPSKSSRRSSSTPETSDVGVRLSQMVLSPVASQLGKKRLLIVADGALQFIPFGVLPISEASTNSSGVGQKTRGLKVESSSADYRPLINEHEIVSLPSASTLAVLRREMKDRLPAEKMVAAIADPVFDGNDTRLTTKAVNDVRSNAERGTREPRVSILGLIRSAKDSGLSRGDGEFPRLPGTRREAEQILSLVPISQRKQAFDFDASRATATNPDLSQYRYVHFATHGFLDSQNPELSGIVLSMFDEKGQPQDGFLRAHEVFNLKLPAELVVLSACRTGLGKEVKGEGLIGLTRGFMYAGAPRVVVSLWRVSDEATAELMTHFYREIFVNGLRPAQALQSAQRAMMGDKRFANPYYWAAFTFQGEWR